MALNEQGELGTSCTLPRGLCDSVRKILTDGVSYPTYISVSTGGVNVVVFPEGGLPVLSDGGVDWDQWEKFNNIPQWSLSYKSWFGSWTGHRWWESLWPLPPEY
jgi:hypothetical protein